MEKKSNIINYKYGLSGKFGDRTYDGIRGFIARQDDVLQLKTFDDIFYTMRLDYEGNTFVYNREIAYIDFSATTYEDTFVPIGKLYEGTETTPSPFGGMGLLKTENNQIVREYKVNYGKALEFKSMLEHNLIKNYVEEKANKQIEDINFKK